MTKILLAAATGIVTAGAVSAGGIDRSGQVITPLYQPGTYAEFSLGSIAPDISGSAGGANSGNMTGDYQQWSVSYKQDLNDRLSFALIFDQPFGADVDYPAGTGYIFGGSKAELTTNALTGILRYKFDGGFAVHAGLRAQTLEANISIPIVRSYTADAERDESFGYLIGASYERPDIALRVALTYYSTIEHEVATTETASAVPIPINSTTKIETPQSVNLEFQTGVAKDTLVFGSARWVDWSEFSIEPLLYSGSLVPGSALVSYANDTITYTLGVGHRFNENWSGLVSVSYEETQGGFVSNLGPTDGRLGLSLGARYQMNNMSITGGINYSRIGSANTRTLVGNSSFNDNDSVGFGLRFGYSF